MRPATEIRAAQARHIAEAVTRAEESRAEDDEHHTYAHIGNGEPLPHFTREQLYGAGWCL